MGLIAWQSKPLCKGKDNTIQDWATDGNRMKNAGSILTQLGRD
jgi:hypothetical protein